MEIRLRIGITFEQFDHPCLCLSSKLEFIHLCSGRQYRGFQPLDVQPEVQSSAEPSTEIVFDDYPPMNSYDTYSSINDNSEL